MLGVKRLVRDDDDDDDGHSDDGHDDQDQDVQQKQKQQEKNVLHIEKKQKKTDDTTTASTTTSKKVPNGVATETFLKQNNIATVTLKKKTGENISIILDLKDEDETDQHHHLKSLKIGSLLKKPLAELEEELLEKAFKPVKKPTNITRYVSNEQARLWVDKYAPASFHDLISDDKMNKDILFWLKQWDQLVFRRKVPDKSKTGNNNTYGFNNNGNNNPHFIQKNNYTNNYSNNNSSFGNVVVQQPLDDGSNGPAQKVILLTGGPGIGKTTLAKILAKQAGYDIQEINASDDRSGEEFDSLFWGALDTQSVFGSKKPKCLIIDEIDGISGRENGPIEMILKLISNDKRSRKSPSTFKGKENDDNISDNSDDEVEEEKNINTKSTTTTTKKQQKKHYPKINRPIICICNDQFAKSLRKLRQEVLIFNFAKPKQSKLLARLKEICELENLKTDDQTLLMLIEKTNYDIRSCLNHLHLFKTTSQVNILQDKGTIIGQKDIEKGFLDTIKNLFTTGKNLKSASNNKKIQIDQEYFRELDDELQSSTQLDKIIGALYENFPSNMKNDFNIDKSIECLEWLSYSDIIYDEKYQSVAPLAVHSLCNTVAPKVAYPQADYQCFLKKEKTLHTIDSFIGTDANKFSSVTKTNFVKDFVSPFIDIISIPIRLVNPQLYNLKEKAVLNNLIQIMKYFNITYKHDTTTDTLQLNPPIDIITQYYNGKDLIKNNDRIYLSRNQKQIVQTAFAQFKLTVTKKQEEKRKEQEKKKIDEFKVPIALPKIDMFAPNEKSKQEEKTIVNVIRYKYQDGFTTAVKKVTLMKDFI
ncbi:AAA ATPase domain-containing protein [Cavenderia fasciculata]|uniref:AAA ATPase domain-containing protein n=1 Tax=Cavenderia fasciculata TaxID=261658 RepID=F4Q4S3_CACFS|nr:AAA ATPase domain-containing protein [Cavenderia fasciculata]EGG17869.1 AAA ATPase domain-containing protein [Cavenderia fasciculata]|eukprot:XP_004356353.1 AAA ATPase domain-containing protein [Cavenderia fasciculata]